MSRTGSKRSYARSFARSSAGGFTLLETLVVLAIISTIAIGALALSGQVSTSARLRDAALQLTDDLALLRSESALRGQVASITVLPARNGYDLVPLGLRRTLPLGVSIAQEDDANAVLARGDQPPLSFHPAGVASAATFTLEAGEARRVVSVAWPSGAARIRE